MRRPLLTAALISLLSSAAVAQTRECFSDLGCPRGKVCVGDERSTRCEELKCPDGGDQPVCGLTGITYRSACRATQLHVGIAYRGACGRCGGATGHSCTAPAFCDIDEGTCGAPRAEGVCHQQPDKCEQGGDPVCGCNGKTYGNDCLRRMAGVPLLHPGACPVAGLDVAVVPPTPASPPVATAPAAPSTQPAVPPVATKTPPETPITGAPPPAASTDAATSTPATVDTREAKSHEVKGLTGSECKADSECRSGEFCERIGRCDGKGEGHCALRPDDCPLALTSDPERGWVPNLGTWDPVCGCDGLTYSNSCWSRLAGQSLRCDDSTCDACVAPAANPAGSGGG